jgi:hypothetical protein
MNRDEFELEKKLRSLSVSEDSGSTNNEREHELAELIANCVADVEPRDNQEEEKKDLSSGENKESELLATSLIVTNLPNELFFQQELKVFIYSVNWMNRFFVHEVSIHFRQSWRACSGLLMRQLLSTTCAAFAGPELIFLPTVSPPKPGFTYTTHRLGIAS